MPLDFLFKKYIYCYTNHCLIEDKILSYSANVYIELLKKIIYCFSKFRFKGIAGKMTVNVRECHKILKTFKELEESRIVQLCLVYMSLYNYIMFYLVQNVVLKLIKTNLFIEAIRQDL